MSQNEQKSLIDTFKSYPFKFKELALDLIETDQNQPRKLFELRNGGDHSRLLKSDTRIDHEEKPQYQTDRERTKCIFRPL